MKNKNNKSHIEGLVVLVLFGVFALCILAVLLTGAGAYGRLVKRQQTTYTERTVPQYIATKVRQADKAGAVHIGEFGGVESLEFTSIYGEETYVTRIYCYDGYLRELFASATGNFTPEDGEEILEAQQVSFEMSSGCLRVIIASADGNITEQILTLRSAEEGVKE